MFSGFNYMHDHNDIIISKQCKLTWSFVTSYCTQTCHLLLWMDSVVLWPTEQLTWLNSTFKCQYWQKHMHMKCTHNVNISGINWLVSYATYVILSCRIIGECLACQTKSTSSPRVWFVLLWRQHICLTI